jgi:5-methylthioadenosine/S-adenosylhomocysteine deaminase
VAEDEQVRRTHAKSAPAFLADLGFFEGRVLAAHSVWLDQDDLRIYADNDVAVAHCPTSNAKLGSGIAPLNEFLSRDIRVGLGTDGPASNNRLDIWEEMRLAALLARAVAAEADQVTTGQALRLATRGGADALGLPVGSLQAGRLADFLHVSLDDATWVPDGDDNVLLAHLVWAASSRLVTDVWVGGEQVVANGRCLTVDPGIASQEVAARSARLVGRLQAAP